MTISLIFFHCNLSCVLPTIVAVLILSLHSLVEAAARAHHPTAHGVRGDDPSLAGGILVPGAARPGGMGVRPIRGEGRSGTTPAALGAFRQTVPGPHTRDAYLLASTFPTTGVRS